MNRYDITYWLVTAVGIIAALAMVAVLVVLVHRLLSVSGHQRVCGWLDDLADQQAGYMEAEQERRAEMNAYGDEPHPSLRRYYGSRFLIERALHILTMSLAFRIWRFQKENINLYTAR
jgi:hypothetical protein